MRARPSHRPERLAELIRETLAAILTGGAQLRDPRIGFVTVTGVEVSPDLAHARIRVSVMGTEAERASTLEGLASAAGFLRSQLARELSLRTSPELRFEIDRGLDHARRIDAVLRELKGDQG
ncbi:MAG TPA: 30S ribosome-binding factor RbfA [Gemmatimonadales bacterium]|nr:30S ribosome-binding factor RbfA [Gemmatimonadales bacterium]